MNKKLKVEFFLGLLVLIISIISVFYYTSKINLFYKADTLQLNSNFFDIGSLNIGNEVKIKGVKVGEVSNISLNQENYMAVVTSSVDKNIIIPNEKISD